MNTQHQSPTRQALHIINDTTDNLFITGKAGTGKTTFLKGLQQTCSKRFIVAAPTGIAAVNAGGVTLHSFFQLPFIPYQPQIDLMGQLRSALPRYEVKGDKLTVIKQLQLLIIDEVSMVRSDLLDAISDALSYYRQNPAPFGGVQLLLIGDLYQLPPFAKPDEMPSLITYPSLYFFASKALAATTLQMVELDKIYRQKNPMFTGFLNEIRNGHISPMGRTLLDKLLTPGIVDDKTITVCSHKSQVEAINQSKFMAIPDKPRIYRPVISGDISINSLPIDAELILKLGARVIFTVNDADKQYHNGSMGTITQLNDDSIEVLLDSTQEKLLVRPYTWKNVTYVVNSKTAQIETREIGNCKQYPLALAWAVTIHKCQGLTFERLAIDASRSFAPGQVYVALSRCRDLEGIRLLSPITQRQLFPNADIESFYSKYN